MNCATLEGPSLEKRPPLPARVRTAPVVVETERIRAPSPTISPRERGDESKVKPRAAMKALELAAPSAHPATPESPASVAVLLPIASDLIAKFVESAA